MLYDTVKSKPFAIVFNTGIWDYDNIARAHRGKEAAEYCDSNSTQDIAEKRASPSVNKTMWEIGDLAKQLGVRVIYRNSHYNIRYGVHCADDLFEAMVMNN